MTHPHDVQPSSAGEGHPSQPAGVTVGVHGMLLVGSDPVYLSHLPMFMAPHNYQVLLKVSLEDDVARRVSDLRAHFGRDALVTVAPKPFPITDLVSPAASPPPLTEFRADVVRGHFEHGGDVIGADSVVRVEQVLYFRELTLARDEAPDRGDLLYLLFGDAERELYLAHRVTAAPDFDQVLVVGITGAEFTERELERQGRPDLVVMGRQDVAEQRLRPGERVAGHTSAGQHFHTDVEVEVVSELYLMEEELR